MSDADVRRELDFRALHDLAEPLLERKQAPIDAVPVPWPSWAVSCRDEGGGLGLARGWHVTMAARTGAGKSVMALNVAAHAVQKGVKTCFVSLEMSEMQLSTRMLAILSGTDIQALEQGGAFSVQSYNEAMERCEEYAKGGGVFWLNREPLGTLDEVLAALEFNAEIHQCRLFIVDYLQLAAVDPNDPSSITEVSHHVRRAAVSLDVSVLGVSQFNRATSATSERPSVFGLMGGSALENDSNQVLLLDHSRLETAPLPVEAWNGYMLLDKNRHGPVGEIPVQFNKRTLQVRELDMDEEPSTEISQAASTNVASKGGRHE